MPMHQANKWLVAKSAIVEHWTKGTFLLEGIKIT